MPVLVELSSDFEDADEPLRMAVKDRRDYATVGFAAARWARRALREAPLGEGSFSTTLRLTVDFLGETETPAPAEDSPKPKRRRKRAAD